MGSEKACESRAPKLPIFRLAPTKPQQQYSVTPPHHTASIPFNWEEKPGKPRKWPAKAHYSSLPKNKNLDLPPRLLRPSKTTTTRRTSLLDGQSRQILLSHPHPHPHPDVGCRPIFHSSRFIMCREVSIDVDQKSLVLSKRWVFEAEEKASLKKTSFSSKESVAKPRFSFLESVYEAVKQAIPSTRRSNNGKWQH